MLFFVFATSLSLSVARCQADFVYDFDDGTLQGFSKRGVFNGTLTNPGSGGNPGGFLKVEDTQAGGGGLQISAPASFHGNLTAFKGIQWDEYLYVRGAGGSRVVSGTDLIIVGGANNSVYRLASNPPTLLGEWHTRFVEFDSAVFRLVSGTDTFNEVLESVSDFAFEMDTSSLSSGPESGIDNVGLVAVPEPASVVLVSLASCIGGVSYLRRMRQIRDRRLEIV